MGMVFILMTINFFSCKDDYYYDDIEPEWLHTNIYDFLNEEGNFKDYVRLIDDLDQKEVLQKTGSKTLFVADDEAFQRFYQKIGISNYEQLSLSQKKLILNYGMINNAYLIETLSSFFDGMVLKENTAMRQETAVSIYDSIPFEIGNQIPDGEYWNKFKSKGIYLLKDNTSYPLTFFLQKQMDQALITNGDFNVFAGFPREYNDAHIFKHKVITRDIRCKNGYVNILDDVLVPPMNMADFILKNSETSIFSSLLERYSAPYYNRLVTEECHRLYPEIKDSVFVKHYFSQIGPNGGTTIYPNGAKINEDFLLPFDPGWNSYVRQSTESRLQTDMAAMFVPNNEAMNDYFESGAGLILKERFGSWENIPNNIIRLLVKRHMRTSFVESVASKFNTMMDEENSVVPVHAADVQNTYLGVNGSVYVTDKVYPPDHFISVYAPVLFSEDTKIFYWAIAENDFTLYLNSLVSKYSFFVPTDDCFNNYIDPIAYNKDVPASLKFWYNSRTSSVNATVYEYNKTTNTIGDSIGVITSTEFIKNRLLAFLNSHIVIGDISDKEFYQTKGTNLIRATGSGLDMQVQGGGDIDQNSTIHIKQVYNQANGNTYFVDQPIQSSLRSVYSILNEKPEFSAFFDLLNGFPSTSPNNIFVRKKNYSGMDFNIKFFNTFHYTVYVPTNDAIQEAIDNGLILPWESQGDIVGINDITDIDVKNDAMENLERFIRYHFQDNAIFLSDGEREGLYQSATLKLDETPSVFGTFVNKFYKIKINYDGNDLNLETENGGTAKVVKDNDLYNIMATDYIFNNLPPTFKEVNGIGTGADFSTSTISTSSFAVIHQIDHALSFK